MSLTNPTDVVTEQRLKDFYDGIFPYLGGMPELLANKFNRSDLYSTDEKIIGSWTDGKPLYQRVYAVQVSNKTVTPNNTTSATTVIAEIGNIDFCMYDGYYVSSSSGNIEQLPYTHYDVSTPGATFYHRIRYEKDSNKNRLIVLSINSKETDQTLNCTFIVVFKYTKTTDSAISVGSDTDYSTTEKIVGTWIDGKPVYQKTVSILNEPIAINTRKYYNLVTGNLNLVNSFGTIGYVQNNITYTKPINNTAYNDALSTITIDSEVIWDGSQNAIRLRFLQTISSGLAFNFYVTVQYTKTTD